MFCFWIWIFKFENCKNSEIKKIKNTHVTYTSALTWSKLVWGSKLQKRQYLGG